MVYLYQYYQSLISRVGTALILSATLLNILTFPTQQQTAIAQQSQKSQQGRPLHIEGKNQEYNGRTQVATVSGNVIMLYPDRGIQATAAQAQYFIRENRIILSGNVYILQNSSNSIRAEVVTYLIDEGRFIAENKDDSRVKATYMIDNNEVDGKTAAPAPTIPSFRRAN